MNTQMNKFRLERYPNNDNALPIMTPRLDVEWEAKAVFNPSVIKDDNVYHMLYRTYATGLTFGEPRKQRPGFKFVNQVSYIGHAVSADGIHFTADPQPFISPDNDFDKYGCEDPRITKLGDTFYITYTAIDGSLADEDNDPNIRIALATTTDFAHVNKLGVVGPDISSKAAALFPELVNGGKVGFALTISPDSTNSFIAVRYFDSIEDLIKNDSGKWNEFLQNSQSHTLLKTDWWLHRGPEIGASPIKTDQGWLFIFSAESMSDSWTISAALADLQTPHKLIARAPGYILQPVKDYELQGLVPDVTFPEGAVVNGEDLYVYYGAADTVIGLATCKLAELIDFLMQFKV